MRDLRDKVDDLKAQLHKQSLKLKSMEVDRNHLRKALARSQRQISKLEKNLARQEAQIVNTTENVVASVELDQDFMEWRTEMENMLPKPEGSETSHSLVDEVRHRADGFEVFREVDRKLMEIAEETQLLVSGLQGGASPKALARTVEEFALRRASAPAVVPFHAIVEHQADEEEPLGISDIPIVADRVEEDQVEVVTPTDERELRRQAPSPLDLNLVRHDSLSNVCYSPPRVALLEPYKTKVPNKRSSGSAASSVVSWGDISEYSSLSTSSSSSYSPMTQASSDGGEDSPCHIRYDPRHPSSDGTADKPKVVRALDFNNTQGLPPKVQGRTPACQPATDVGNVDDAFYTSLGRLAKLVSATNPNCSKIREAATTALGQNCSSPIMKAAFHDVVQQAALVRSPNQARSLKGSLRTALKAATLVPASSLA